MKPTNETPIVMLTVGQLKELILESNLSIESKKDPEEEEEILYTTKEACEILRCSRPTLHRWKKNGIISFVRIGVSIRYRGSELNKIINSGVKIWKQKTH